MTNIFKYQKVKTLSRLGTLVANFMDLTIYLSAETWLRVEA